MPPQQSIPGFYYDEERKKYFKVLPSHLDSDSRYSKKRLREAEEEKRVSKPAISASTQPFSSTSKTPCRVFGAESDVPNSGHRGEIEA